MASTPKATSSTSNARPVAGRGTPSAAAAAAATTTTPARRARSDEPPSSRPSLRTPLDRSGSRNLLASIRRGPARSNAPTPHAKAARLALSQRRNALFTPGKNRRRSLMEQRETPMAVLRNLSRALAPKSRPVATSSSPSQRPSSVAPIPEDQEGRDDYDDDDDDELSIDRPRLSLPLDQDDSGSDPQPPRSSGLEDENYTVQSVELPRRAVSEQPGARLSRSSFGDGRISDFFDQGSNDPTLDAGRRSDFFPGFLEQLQAGSPDRTLNRIDLDAARRATMGRESDFGLELPPGLDEQTTFLLSEPEAGPNSTSLIEDPSLAEAEAAEEAAEGDDEPPDDPLIADSSGLAADTSNQAIDVSSPNQTRISDPAEPAPRARKRLKRISQRGIEYPPLPPSFVKKTAQTALHSSGLSNPRISADTLAALTQASDWFFEQLGDDLGAYAKHAKRKTIEESDVVALMRRQRQVGSDATLFSVAQRHLPREMLQHLRMPVPQPIKKRRGKRGRNDDDDDDERRDDATRRR